MDHPLLILAAAHAGAAILGLVAGGWSMCREPHRLLYGRLAGVAGLYLGAACAWADWSLAGTGGAVAGVAIPVVAFAAAWCCAVVVRLVNGRTHAQERSVDGPA